MAARHLPPWLQRAYDAVRSAPGVTPDELCMILDMPLGTVWQVLRDLRHRGLVVQHTKRRGAFSRKRTFTWYGVDAPELQVEYEAARQRKTRRVATYRRWRRVAKDKEGQQA